LNIDEMKRLRAALMDEYDAIPAKAEEEGREITVEEEKRAEEIVAEVQRLTARIERDQQMAAERIRYVSSGPVTRTGGGDPSIGMSKGEIRRYSLLRAIRALAGLGSRAEAALEFEASDAVARSLGRETQGVYVPWDVMANGERRDITVGTEGVDIVATEFQPPIDLLRDRLVTRAAGATVLTGLRGDVQFPRLAGGATGAWVAEGAAPSETTQTFGQVKLSPKQLAAFSDITRQTLLQASFDVEAMVRSDMTAALATEIDRAALHGTGASNQPTGVINQSGVGVVSIGANGGAPTWAHIVALEEQVAIANADVGRLAYITNPKVRRKLKATSKAGTEAIFVWGDGDTPVNGYRALVTNLVASNLTKGTGTNLSAVFFGNWEELLIGIWGDIEVIVDPYTASTTGTVRIVTLANADVGVRHGGSFAVIKDADTT